MKNFYNKLSSQVYFKHGKPYHSSTHKELGSIAGGYRRLHVSIDGIEKKIYAHRLHWFMIYGYIPSIIDHINRKPDDNRIENLREVTHQQNMRNRTPSGASQYLGVSWHKLKNKWTTTCRLNGKRCHIGYFINEDAAGLAYDIFCVINDLDYANLNFGRSHE